MGKGTDQVEFAQRPERKRPTGFVATCQCGLEVGALDLERSDRADVAKLLGQWLMHGCTVTPRFTGKWSARIQTCECGKPPRPAHVCGLQGFGALGDACEACDLERVPRHELPNV